MIRKYQFSLLQRKKGKTVDVSPERKRKSNQLNAERGFLGSSLGIHVQVFKCECKAVSQNHMIARG